ncbi:MAG: hypothetical protein M1828_000506 [Chrysothrix sp. TS-e1954]|nr:MAG: hypothetical protein M1828_000506 [Chrysothrix sp. TS-e1954]
MKFLCFHGATTNSETSWEKDHLRRDLELDDTASFHFIEGLFPSEPIRDVEYECPAPNLRWYDHNGIDLTKGVKHFSEMLTFKNMTSPEDGARRAWEDYSGGVSNGTELMVEYARNIIEDEGPFDGFIGASEGGSAAATVLMDQLQLSRKQGQACTIQCAIFFVAAAPLTEDGKGYLLSDTTDQRITVPTCHVYSEKDLLCWMAKALENVCQDDGKTTILHEGGHTIPHTEKLMVDVAKFVRKVKQGDIQGTPLTVHNAARG